jgi:hypothetical protein
VTGKQQGQPPASQILMALMGGRYSVCRTPDGKPFVTCTDAPSVMIPLYGTAGLRQRLMADYARQVGGKLPSTESLRQIMDLAEGLAISTAYVARPYLRLARRGGLTYLDLGRADGLAVEIGAGWWKVVKAPPVLFMRTALTGELPVPVPGSGSVDDVRDLINIPRADEWALYVACRIASLFPGITHPVESFIGPAGSAKTSAMRLTSNWVDPAQVMCPVPRNSQQWGVFGGARYVLAVDNVSRIDAWWSDLLCKAASGDGWMDRALYTDGDIYVSAFRSVIMLNGIDLGVMREDLADRMIIHKMVKPPGGYLADDALEEVWSRCHGLALSWLLDQAASVTRELGTVPAAPEHDRLVTFTRIVRVLDRLWGTHAAGLLALDRLDLLADISEGDVVAMALMTAIPAGTYWQGTSSELLALLRYQGNLVDGKYTWTPRMLSERINRVHGSLGALGWHVARYRVPGTRSRIWAITSPPGN